MLYDRWRAVARERRHELALSDFASGRRWTFAQLAAATEQAAPAAGGVVYPQGNGVEFIFDVLRAWRTGDVVCPLEIGQAPPAIPKPPPGCVHLKTTSATTGAPRVIAFTASQLMADGDNIVATMGLRPDWPNLAVISLAHSYGYSNLVLALLLHGIPAVLAPAVLPDLLRRVAAGHPALTLPSVPVLWRAWHEAQAIPANVRLAISAGAPLPAALEQAVFAASGLKIHNFYGASECGGIAYDASPEPRAEELCVGTPMKQVTLGLTRSGCLAIRSAAVGQTYWPEPETALRGGVFRTSDLAELKAGRVYLCGRVGDQINVAGRKFSPVVVERVLAACSGVQDCLAFGIPSGKRERAEQVVACVVARPSLTVDTLKTFAAERLPPWQVPRLWWFVEALSGNQRGKLSRAEWRRRYLASSQKKA